MSYPRLPLGRTELERKTAQAVNHLLDQFDLLYAKTTGAPAAGQSLVGGPIKFPVRKQILASHTVIYADVAATADAIANITIGGVTAGTATWLAGATQAVVALTTRDIPALTEWDVVAPTPADATLSDIHTAIALEV